MVDSELVLSENGLDILKDNRGEWFVRRGNTIQNLAESNSIMALPLLEYEYQYVLIKLSSAFPFQTLVEIALTNQSQHWVALALNWLESAALNVNQDTLQKLMLDKSLPQGIRHQVKKLIHSGKNGLLH